MYSRVGKCFNVSPLHIYRRRLYLANIQTLFRCSVVVDTTAQVLPTTPSHAPHYAMETGPHSARLGLCNVVVATRIYLSRFRRILYAMLGMTRYIFFFAKFCFSKGTIAGSTFCSVFDAASDGDGYAARWLHTRAHALIFQSFVFLSARVAAGQM